MVIPSPLVLSSQIVAQKKRAPAHPSLNKALAAALPEDITELLLFLDEDLKVLIDNRHGQ